jgi:hypothetical protein
MGWAPAFRDATMLKVAYAWGLRRREVRMLETNDFGSNPRAPVRCLWGLPGPVDGPVLRNPQVTLQGCLSELTEGQASGGMRLRVLHN